MRFRFAAWTGLALLVAGCGSTTAPTPPRTPAAPTTTESFIGSLGIGSSRFYSYSVAQYGTVNVTLNSVEDANGPSAVALGVGVGTPAGTGCANVSMVTAGSGPTVLLTAPYEAGIYCVRVFDVGNLTAAATFNVSIAHP